MDGNETVGGGYTFNTGMRQVEFISDLSNNAVKSYFYFRSKPDQEKYEEMKNMMEAFALTVAARAKPDDLEDFEHIVENGSDNISPVNILEKIDELPEEHDDLEINQVRNMYIEIIKLMKDLKLDIPKQQERDPHDVV